MTRPADRLDHIRHIASSLDPDQFRSKVREYERYGYPSSSLPAGRPGSEPPLPLPDRYDRHLRQAVTDHDRLLHDAHQMLQMALRLENAVLIPVPPMRDDTPVCSTPGCDRPLKSGEQHCQACRQHKHRHGHYPKPAE